MSKNIIIGITKKSALSPPVAAGTLVKFCKENALPYYSLKMLKFPIELQEMIIHKVKI